MLPDTFWTFLNHDWHNCVGVYEANAAGISKQADTNVSPKSQSLNIFSYLSPPILQIPANM